MLLHLEVCQQSRPWECGNPEGISKECGKGGKPASWLSMLSILCHFHGLLWKRRSQNHSQREGRFGNRNHLSEMATIRQYEWSWLGCDGDSRSCFDGASAIKTAPMITRTATPISSPRATMLRHAWVPMSAA